MCGITYHPDVRAMIDYWQSIHPERGLPGRRHFEPASVKQLLPTIRLIDVDGPPYRFRVRLAGTEITEFYRVDHTGRWFDEFIDDFEDSETYRDLVDVVTSGRPGWRLGVSRIVKDREFQTFERLILPFAKDGENVDMLLIFMVFAD